MVWLKLYLSKMSLQLQIIVPLFITIAAGVGFSMLSGYQASHGQRELAGIVGQALDARTLTNKISTEIQALENDAKNILDMTAFTSAETVNWQFTRHDTIIRATLGLFSKNNLSDEISTEVEALNHAYAVWRESLQVALGLSSSNAIPTAEKLLRERSKLASISKRLNAMVTTTAEVQGMAAIHSLDSIIRTDLKTKAVGGIIALFICWLVARHIATPILGITSKMNVLADGVTSFKLPERTFASEINNMIDALGVFQRNAAELAQAHRETEAARSIAHSISRQDPLTSVPNRRVFTEHVEELSSADTLRNNRFAVLLIDLDRFKPINDIYGHEIGDFVICEVANRLQAAIKHHGVVARLGGDEFGIVFSNSNISDIRHSAQLLAEKIVKLIESPIKVENILAEISASIGVAIYPDHGTDAQSLLRAADLAMYHVKNNGRSSHSLFNPSLDVEMRATAKIENDTRIALRDQAFIPYFQPVIDLSGNNIYGFEVLARWQHEERGFVPPDRFIPILEQCDLMNDFTDNILRQACMAAREWPINIKLALNISANEVCDPATPMRLMSILAECKFLPTRLEIEITETALVKNFDTANSVITALREAGIRVLLDDFGTGYSSLSYLKELPIDCLKIDRSFTISMDENKESENIVISMLSLAQSLGLDTVVEGVENATVHDRIRQGNGTFGQGYYYSKPLPAEEAKKLLIRKSVPSSKRA